MTPGSVPETTSKTVTTCCERAANVLRLLKANGLWDAYWNARRTRWRPMQMAREAAPSCAAPPSRRLAVPTRLGHRVVPAVPTPLGPLPLVNRRHHSVASNQAAQALLPLRRLRRGSLQPPCHDPRRDRADPTNNQNTACLACVPPPPFSPTRQIHQRAAIKPAIEFFVYLSRTDRYTPPLAKVLVLRAWPGARCSPQLSK
jgi:hypothetical protein